MSLRFHHSNILGNDADRGLVVFLLFAEQFGIGAMARPRPDSAFGNFLHTRQSLLGWTGCVLQDLIQPSFSFLVEVAPPFPLASV